MKSQDGFSVKQILRVILQWFFLCVFLGGVLGGYLILRKAAIQQEHKRQQNLLKQVFMTVLPAFDNRPWEEPFRIGHQTFYPGICQRMSSHETAEKNLPMSSKNGKLQKDMTGYAFVMRQETSHGVNRLLVGADRQGKITGIQWLIHDGGTVLRESRLNQPDFLKLAMRIALEASDSDGTISAQDPWLKETVAVVRKADILSFAHAELIQQRWGKTA